MKILFDGRVLEGPSSGVRDIAAGLVVGMRQLQRIGRVDFSVATVERLPESDITLSGRFFMHVGLPLAAFRGRYDRLLVPRQTVPVISAVRRVPVFHDIGFIERPDLYRDTRAIAFTTRLASRSRSALAVSPYTAERLASRKLKTNVTPLDIGAIHAIKWQPETTRPYILCIAAQEPHKNLPALIEAWDRVGDDRMTLVLCGREGADTIAVRRALSRTRSGTRIRIASGLDDPSYARLLTGAFGYVQPSLYEGLCIPAMDMAAAGVPMVVGDQSNLGVRFSGAPSGQCVDVTDIHSLSAALSRLTRDQAFRDASSRYNGETVRMTDWASVAEQVLEAA